MTLVNREEGAGARLLLDQRLRAAGINYHQVRGYGTIVASHFEVARAVAARRTSESAFDPLRNSLNSTSSRFKPRATTLSSPKPI